MPIDWFSLSVLVVCLGLSFLLSGMEAGVFALSRLRIRQMTRTENPAAKLLLSYLEHPENFLWTILAGNTVANFAIVSLVVLVLHGWLGNSPALFILVFAIFLFLFYAFFDLLPKMLFRIYPNRLCLLMVRPFRFIHLSLGPLVAVMETCSEWLLRWTSSRAFKGIMFGNRDELRLLMQESSEGLSSEERQMINRVLDLQNLTVRQVMIPLSLAVSIDQNSKLGVMLDLCRAHNLTRLPVWDNSTNVPRIVGISSLNNFLFRQDGNVESTVRDFVKPALYMDGEMRLEVALQRMQRAGQRLAIVLGRDQREIGIVSLQDILKVVFGEVSL